MKQLSKSRAIAGARTIDPRSLARAAGGVNTPQPWISTEPQPWIVRVLDPDPQPW